MTGNALRAMFPVLSVAALAAPQVKVMNQGPHRMEITLERLESDTWKVIDPGLVLQQGDRVRFQFRTNFDGYLYVMNQSSSGKYEQLFPSEDAGQNNHIVNGNDYQVPATSGAFRVAPPAGYETVYWLVSPLRLSNGPPPRPRKPMTLMPRCDDTIMRSRGDCVDSSAGPKLVPRGVELPQTLAQAAPTNNRDLLFMRQDKSAVISSPEPLTGPVIYEFRLAHR